jgi:hypothetical protein
VGHGESPQPADSDGLNRQDFTWASQSHVPEVGVAKGGTMQVRNGLESWEGETAVSGVRKSVAISTLFTCTVKSSLNLLSPLPLF